MISKNTYRYSMLLIALFMITALAISLDFDVNPTIHYPTGENHPTVEDTINCTWEASIDAEEVNVSWYINNTLIKFEYNTSYNYSILTNATIKENNITCMVSIGKTGENSISRTDNVTIKNSQPTLLIIKEIFSPYEEINYENKELTEDQAIEFTINSTDPDMDSLTYYVDTQLSDEDFCTITGTTVTCNPTEEDEIGEFNFVFKAWDGSSGSIRNVNFVVSSNNDAPYFNKATTYSKTGSYYTGTENSIGKGSDLIDTAINDTWIFNYKIEISDDENQTGPFNFSINSTTLDPNLNFTRLADNIMIIHFLENNTAGASKRGNHSITVTACDPETPYPCVNSTFDLEIKPENRAPAFEYDRIIFPAAEQGDNFNVTLYATDPDVALDDLLNFSITSDSCSLAEPWSLTVLNQTAQNGTAFINFTLTNSHIACRYVNISVEDLGGLSDSMIVRLNITNVNDPPVISEHSHAEINSHDNDLIYNLTAITGMEFRYQVNASDIDIYTYEMENINYSTNATLCDPADCLNFTIDPDTGYINFTANESYAYNNYSYELIVTDDDGANDNITFMMHIIRNNAPGFDDLDENLSGTENTAFLYDINWSDTDGNPANISTNSTFFNITNSGLISFTPVCEHIGSWNISVKINDTYGAENYSSFILNISNNPDAPSFSAITAPYAMETIPYSGLNLSNYVTDADISCANADDQLTFSYVFIGANIPDFNFNTSEGFIRFTPPNLSTDGVYTINATVNDSFGLSDSIIFNITILNLSEPPTIANVTGWNPEDLHEWAPTSTFENNKTSLAIYERTNLTLNYTILDEQDPGFTYLKYYWLINNTLHQESTSHLTLNKFYNWSETRYDHNASDIITLQVIKNISGVIASNISFQWNYTIMDLNRPPELVHNLSNLTVNKVFNQNEYFTSGICGEGNNSVCEGFVDYDGDWINYSLYENLSTPEINSKITVTIVNDSIEVVGKQVGTYYVVFQACDRINCSFSNNVTINVTSILIEATEIEEIENTQTKTNTIVQIITQEIEKELPIFLDIITPQPLTVYLNNTLIAPIILHNKGNETLSGIQLSAATNNSLLDLEFSDDFFPKLDGGEKVSVDLTIQSYKTFSNYEIVVYANITDPDYDDKALIYVNSLEKSNDNDTMTNTKITFARDLLASNPECLELNEYLKKAQDMIKEGNEKEGLKMVDAVIQGCKYLVSKRSIAEEFPEEKNIIAWITALKDSPYFIYILSTIAGTLIIGMIVKIAKKPKTKHKKKK